MNEIVTTSTTLDALPTNIKLELVKIEVRTEDAKRANNESIVKIGEWLTNTKTFLKHGEWQNWLNDNFNMTYRTARRYMQIVSYFGQNGHFSKIMSVLPVGGRLVFLQHFAKFGVVLYTQKKPVDTGDTFQQN